jgi:hypothetical protein
MWETSDSDVSAQKQNRSVMTPPKNLGRATDWLGAIRTKTFFCPRSFSAEDNTENAVLFVLKLDEFEIAAS